MDWRREKHEGRRRAHFGIGGVLLGYLIYLTLPLVDLRDTLDLFGGALGQGLAGRTQKPPPTFHS